MKKTLLLFLVVLVTAIGCGRKNQGELVGVKSKKFFPEKPYGMTLIPGGAFVMGMSDDDVVQLNNAPTRTVTVKSFYMDETEITNGEYRQFVNWVKDSVIRMKLAIAADFEEKTPEDEGIGEFAFRDVDTTDLSVYQKYMFENYYEFGDDQNPYKYRRLNWDVDIYYDTEDYPDMIYAEVLDSMYLHPDESFNGERTIDVKQLKYQYTWFDAEAAAKSKGKNRKEFFRQEAVPIYPDTTVWIKDFAYSYNEPMHNDYFWHRAFADYPVVGVSWKQARAFAHWRTKIKNDYNRTRKNKPSVSNFRLPTEAEWEFAARGGLASATYPWGSHYTLNDEGCFLANFKPQRGDYASDLALYTVEAKSYEPNDYGLYNMAGNVAEWTESSYDPGAYDYVASFNPNVSIQSNKRKVIRGGSWKDVAYFLRVSARDFEYADSTRSYIGFRTVQDYMGTDAIQISN